jgi:hypothetical protein
MNGQAPGEMGSVVVVTVEGVGVVVVVLATGGSTTSGSVKLPYDATPLPNSKSTRDR